MKFLVCVTTTPDTTARVAFTADGKTYDSAGVSYIMNPYDEWYALVRAIELKEQLGGTVTILNVGDAQNDAIIRKGLAIGADDAIRVDAQPTDAFFVAHQIAAHAKGYDIVFLGKESIDYNGAEVGAMVAELLDLPYVSFSSALDLNGNLATVHREIEGGVEVVEVEAPFVLSAAKGMAEQRLAGMQGIMMAKRKPLNVVAPVAVETQLQVAGFTLPPPKSGVKMVAADQMDELVRLLHEEAKVL